MCSPFYTAINSDNERAVNTSEGKLYCAADVESDNDNAPICVISLSLHVIDIS